MDIRGLVENMETDDDAADTPHTNVPDKEEEVSIGSKSRSEASSSKAVESNGVVIATNSTAYKRNLIGFWLLGLTNNFAYVIMLSAAHDILSRQESGDGHGNSPHSTTTTIAPNTTERVCNKTSTGAVLLADILPTLIVKLTAPWFIHKIRYRWRVVVVVSFAGFSFIIVALSTSVAMSLFGVVCASISAGLGEPTFLSLTSYYDSNTVSTWSSGTGGAGVVGALAYAGLTTAGLTPRNTLFVMLVVPVLLAVTYFIILVHPPQLDALSERTDSKPLLENDMMTSKGEKMGKRENLGWRHKARLVMPLIWFMLPLAVVYFAEYFINQGLMELLQYRNTFLTLKEQYRWFQVDYQVGVFISRSSVNFFPVQKIWILALLQCGNMVFFIFEAYYLFIPSIWIMLALVFFEGLLGGSGYVNTFFMLRNQTEENDREFSLTFASVADSSGIALAGAVALPVHNAICATPIPVS